MLSLPTDPIFLPPILPAPIIISYCLIQLCGVFWQKDQDAMGFTIMHHADLCYLIKSFYAEVCGSALGRDKSPACLAINILLIDYSQDVWTCTEVLKTAYKLFQKANSFCVVVQ